MNLTEAQNKATSLLNFAIAPMIIKALKENGKSDYESAPWQQQRNKIDEAIFTQSEIPYTSIATFISTTDPSLAVDLEKEIEKFLVAQTYFSLTLTTAEALEYYGFKANSKKGLKFLEDVAKTAFN